MKKRKRAGGKPGAVLAHRLLSLQRRVRPDDVSRHYHDRGVELTIRMIGQDESQAAPSVLIEGDQEALLFLADLLLAQASDALDCGFEIPLSALGG